MAFNDLGFRAVFFPRFFPSASTPLPDLADPRGILRPGMVPARNFQYKVLNGTIDTARSQGSPLAPFASSPLGAGALSTFAALSVTSDVVFVKARVQSAVLFFEGRDVIDLPVEGLEREGDVLIVPDRVFRPLFAGEEQFVGPNDNLADRAALAYGGFLEDNLIVGIEISPDAPPDTRNGDTGFRAVDASSTRIRISPGSNPNFISYVAADRLLFRDVILVDGNVSVFGETNPLDGFLANSSSALDATATLLRYAFVDVSEEGEDARFQWKLSESFGLAVKPPIVVSAPSSLLGSLSEEDRTKELLAVQNNHFVYDLSESIEGSLTDSFRAKPQNTGYSPAFARAKTDPTSEFFDENFRAQLQDFELGFGAGGTLVVSEIPTSVSSIAGSLSANTTATFSYVSQNYNVDLGSNGRVGLEYSLQIPSGLSTPTLPNLALFMAKTVEASNGIAALNDPAISFSKVFDTDQSTSTIVERKFDDFAWMQGNEAIPQSSLGRFLLGEIPFRSEGTTILLPQTSSLQVSDNSVDIPDGAFVVGVVTGFGENGFQFSLVADDPENPVFEANMPFGTSKENRVSFLGTPPLSFSSVLGSSITSVGIAEQSAVILEAFPEGDPETPQGLQQGTVEDMTFPVAATSLHACSDDDSGMVFIAFENGDRIDMALKTSPEAPYGIIRDVVLRIPDEFGNGATDNDIPPASLPFLLCDEAISSLLLFYAYKNKLLVKRIPLELFKSEVVGDARRYDLDKELILSRKIQDISASVVYDGDGDNESIAIDLEYGSITPFGSNTEETTEPPRKVTQYSAYINEQGYVMSFVQAEGTMVVRRSPNVGGSWLDALPRSFSFVPALEGDSETVYGEAPFVHVDPATETVFVFFFLESSLLFLKVPSELFMLPPAEAAEELSSIVPRVVVGALSEDMQQRGISSQATVIEGEDPIRLSPHRIGAITTPQGYSRVFFKDQDQKLRSIISNNGGETWDLEEAYQAKSKC